MHKIGFTAGSFDLLHPGYIRLFKEAKTKCDYLIVGLHKDPSKERVNKIKPVLSIEDRVEILESIKYIDQIEIYESEEDLEKLLANFTPDIRFLGDDYIDRQYTGIGISKQVHFVDRKHNWSTTKFKQQIYENYLNFISKQKEKK